VRARALPLLLRHLVPGGAANDVIDEAREHTGVRPSPAYARR
jgi:hypothetical protein